MPAILAVYVFFSCSSNQKGGEVLWNKVLRLKVEEKTDSLLTALNLYQMNYPKGSHQYTAENLKERIQTEQNDWITLMKSYPSRDEIVQFIKNHPEGFYRQPALEQIDHIDYAKAVDINTEESYAEYLRLYPDGLHSHDAKTRYNKFQGVVSKLTDLEKRDVRDLLIRHFVAFQNGDSTIVETLDSEIDYWDYHSNTPEEVCQLMDSIHRKDYRLIYTMDSVSIHKVLRYRPFVYMASFGMSVHYLPKDPEKREYSTHYYAEATVTYEMKIKALRRSKTKNQ